MNYLVFQGAQYYPCAGWGDFSEDFDTERDAKNYVLENARGNDWWQIVDFSTHQVIDEGCY